MRKAEQFFKTQLITDSNSVVNQYAKNYNRFELLNFAEAYFEWRVKNCNTPDVSKSEGIEREALLLAFATWLHERDFTDDSTSIEDWVKTFLSQ